MALLIRGGHVRTNDDAGTLFDPGDILIEGDRIVAIGSDLCAEAAARPGHEVLDATGAIVLPGFVDAHMHSNEGFEMGLYDNLPLEPWLNEVYPPFGAPALTWREHYLRALLVGIVSLKSGVTTLQDDVINLAFTPDAVDATCRAYADLGLRAWVTASMWDRGYRESLPFVADLAAPDLMARLDALPVPGRDDQIALFRHHHANWHGRDGLIRIILGPSGPQRCSVELIQAVTEISAALDLPVHCHVLETKTQAVTGQVLFGKTLVRHLDDIGALTRRLTMNHAIWLSDDDMARMGAAGCSITHNPLANLKLGSGVAPVRRLKTAGVNVALGCDGVASADTADIFAAVKMAAMLHKIGSHDPADWVSAHEAYHMATKAAARSGLMEHEVGSLEVGKRADVILLDRKHWGFLPLHDPVKQIAFSASSEAVRTSIVNGRVVMRDRRLTLVNETAVREEIAEAAERFRTDHLPAMQAGAAPMRPVLAAMHAKATAMTVEAGHIPLRMPPAHAKIRA